MTPTLRLSRHIFSAGLGIALAGLLTIGGCQQGEGDACQVDSDCEEGLICVPGIAVCQKPGGSVGTADAAPRPDANTSVDDAATPDATVPDAGGPDAALVDAGPPDAAPNT